MANYNRNNSNNPTPFSLHSLASVNKVQPLNNLQPTVQLHRLKLNTGSTYLIPSSTSFNHGFHNAPRVVLSPLRTSLVKLTRINYVSPNSRHRVYPKISKCNAKKCMCCKHISSQTTIKSTVNGRTFSILLNKDVDCNTSHVIYVLT